MGLHDSIGIVDFNGILKLLLQDFMAPEGSVSLTTMHLLLEVLKRSAIIVTPQLLSYQ